MLEATDGSRVVVVSSGGMYNTKWPEWGVGTAEEGTYSGNLAYAYAKRGQVLLCEHWAGEETQTAGRQPGSMIKFVSCHPVSVMTDIQSNRATV